MCDLIITYIFPSRKPINKQTNPIGINVIPKINAIPIRNANHIQIAEIINNVIISYLNRILGIVPNRTGIFQVSQFFILRFILEPIGKS